MCIITSSIAAGVATAVTIASTAISTTLGVIGAQQSAKAQAAQYEYQSQIAQNNAKITEQNAALERQSGLEEARRQRIKTLQTVGSQKAALAANGIDIGMGTSLDIIEDTAQMGELDALMIETRAERNARNFEIQAGNFKNDSNLASLSARNVRSSGTLNMLSEGISGLGKLSNSYNYGTGLGNFSFSKGLKLSGGFDTSNSGLLNPYKLG